MDRTQVMSDLIQRSEELLGRLAGTEDLETRLTAVELFLSEREALIAELHDLPDYDDSLQREELKQLDTRIHGMIREWMSETGAQLGSLRQQREGILHAKRTNAGYLKMQANSEGYFIDRKK